MNQKNVEVTIVNQHLFVSAARQRGRGSFVLRLGGVLIITFLGLMVIGVQPAAAATTWYVDGVVGNDANSCTMPGLGMACKTIQAAVNKASSGDTIMVAMDIYMESVSVPIGLLIKGPNVGISPNGGTRLPEAVIDGGGSTSIRISTTASVTIDGFTFSGQSGAAIDSYTSGNNPTIRHNIVTAGADGFYFNEPALFTFEDNYLHDLMDCGGCDGIFIAGNWNGATGTVASIKNNVWLRVLSSGMNLSNVSGTISGNHFSYVTYYGALLANGTNVAVSGNTFDHTLNPDITVPTWGSGVRFYTPSTGFGARITDNMFSSNYVGIGVRMGSPTADITGLDVYAHQNNFEGNTSYGIRHDGLGTFNATCNWWNSTTGPMNAGNPGGTGDAVIGPVNFTPWLTAPAPAGSCVGGVPTPAKVTGGGQVPVNGGTGTFGFNAKQASQSGHLNYINHATGAHLDCTVNSVTIFSSTNASFSGTCSPNSSAGTFMAQVQDSATPGKNADQFFITYGTTINEGGTLISGNIQIQQ